MSVSQQVVYQPPSEDIKYVDGPPGSGSDGAGNPPGAGSGDGGNGSSPPGAGGGDGSTPPGAGGGDGSTPPVAGGGGGSTPPGAGGGDGSTPPGSGGGDGSTPPAAGGGDGSTPPVAGGGGSTPPGSGGGDGSTPPGDTSGLTIGIDPVLTVGLGGGDGNGLAVNVLTPPDATDSHGINVNVLGDGTGENLLDVGLLPNDGGIGLPGTDDPGSGDTLGLGPLLSVDTGGDGQGLAVNVLTPPDASDTHGVNLNVLGNGDGENLLDIGLLPNTGTIGLPGTGEPGSGHPLDLGSLLSVSPSGADGNGLSVNALTGPDATDTDGLNVNVLDTGDGQNLIDIGLPPASGLGLPGIGDAGAGNGLAGGLLNAEGGLLNGTIGDLNGSSTGHLIDLDIGPQTPNGLGLDLLSTPDADPTHAVSISAIDVGPDGPQLADLGVLTGSGILDVPSLGGTGTDSLAGNLLGSAGLLGGLLGGAGMSGGILNGDIASGNAASAPVNAPLDVTALTDTITAPLAGDHGLLDLHGAHIL